MKRRITCEQADEFLRIYQIGFVAVWPVLGLASGTGWSAQSVAALVIISAAFNTFGGVLNDICDLESDRLSPERADRWLVSGVVSKQSATLLVLAQVPLMVAVHAAAGFRTAALGWLAIALAGEAFYDLRAKKSRMPPVPEAGQAIAAGALVCYGATCLDGHLPWLALWTAIAAWAMLHLANAFHGGLRDLRDDLQARVRTTPLFFGCGLRGNDRAISPAMSAYGTWWLTVMMGASLAATRGASLRLTAAVLAEWVILVALFVSLHHLRGPAWEFVVRLHVTALVAPMITAYGPLLGVRRGAVLLFVFVLPSLPLVYRHLRANLPAAQPKLAAPA